MNAAVTLALLAGLVAAVNPCGFAMLPAYVGYFVGRDDADAANPGERILRAVPVALAVSGGFMAVFGTIGFLLGALDDSFASTIQERAPWALIAIGIALAVLGIAMLFGFELTTRIPKLQVGDGGRGLWSMFLFGVSYAVASVSCTFGVFLATVVNAGTREGGATRVLTVVAYGLGMSLVITAVTLAVALARESIVKFLRSSMRYVNRVSGALMVVIAAYIAWYGVFSLRVRNDPTADAGPVDLVERWSGEVNRWIQEQGETTVSLVLVGVIAGILGLAWYLTRVRGAGRTEAPEAADEPASEPEPESVS